MKQNTLLALLLVMISLNALAIDNKGITSKELSSNRFTLIENGIPNAILIDEKEDVGVMIATDNL